MVFDCCKLNITSKKYSDSTQQEANRSILVEDTSTAFVRVFLKGLNFLYTASDTSSTTCTTIPTPSGCYAPGRLTKFSNNFSSIIDEGGNIVVEENGVIKPYVVTPMTTTGAVTIKASRGTANIPYNFGYVTVTHPFITPNSLVFAQLRTYDPNGAIIRFVLCSSGSFTVYLTQAASLDLSVGFRIEY